MLWMFYKISCLYLPSYDDDPEEDAHADVIRFPLRDL